MNVYRRDPVPAIYTCLRFVRDSGHQGRKIALVDCPDDLPRLRQLQSVIAGKACVSELERLYDFIVKAEIPDEIKTLSGNSYTLIEWRMFYWRLWDAKSLVTEQQPVEAVRFEDADIDIKFLNSLASRESCLPFLEDVEVKLTSGSYKGSELSPQEVKAIKDIETDLFSEMKLIERKKQLRLPKSRSRGSPRSRQVSPKLRNEILNRDKYRCVICGQGGPEGASLELNHIVPRSLINKLHLEPTLHTAPENLCTMCFACNRGRSDNLSKEEITHYLDLFSSPQHPNHGLRVYLTNIANLQAL